MKICFFAAASLIHTVRWANALAARGHEMHVISMHAVKMDKLHDNVRIHRLKIPAPFGYYLNWLKAKKLVYQLKPDLLLVHYASGYGTLARLVKFEPTMLCVLGSDVYLFPYQSSRRQKLLRKNLAAANLISSTSKAMREKILQFTGPDASIEVVPFGIDMQLFQPSKQPKQVDMITIGTVKRLEKVYGIDTLLQVVAKLISKLQVSNCESIADKIRVLIVGDGSELANLQKLAVELGIAERTTFAGAVANEEVPAYLNRLDIYCAFSRSESFGVAVLEASACEVPVVVNDTGGLPEVVQHDKTGYIVTASQIDAVAERLMELVIDEDKRKVFGSNGRKFVEQNYDWQENVLQMEANAKRLVDRYLLKS